VSAAPSAVFTIVAGNYLAYAQTLIDSLAECAPKLERFVFVVDAGEGAPSVRDATVLLPADIFDWEFYAGLAYSSDVTELSTAVKPFVLRHLLGRGHPRAFYFDPDIEVFAPLDPVMQPLDRADVVLTPHTTEPIPLDGKQPDEIVLLRAGAFNLGFIGVARGAAGEAMLDWWAQRLERFCRNDVASGLFTDQKWVDLVPGLVERTAIVRHRGCNVAYWNLHARRVDPSDPHRLTTGEPIVFFHYSGFDVRRPATLSKHQTRIDVASEPGLARLLGAYASRVKSNGFDVASAAPYGFARFSNGVALDAISRDLLRDARLGGVRFPDPGDVAAQPSAWAYLCGPAEQDTGRGASPRFSRYLYRVWQLRPDLRAAFADVFGADRGRYAEWLVNDRTTGIPTAYLAEAGLRARWTLPSSDARLGVNVVGYFRTESGVGEAGRGSVAALQAAGIATRLIDFSAHAPSRGDDASVGPRADEADQRITLVCVNADQVPHFLDHGGRELVAGKYAIGSWWWELAQFPDTWRNSFEPFDEIWAGTQFVATAVSAKSPVPVVIVPPVVSVGAVRTGRRSELAWRADETIFLFVFDYRSVFERKNPIGVVDAFRRAFPRGSEPVRLIVKSINAEIDPRGRARIRAAAAGDSRVELLDGYVSRDQKNELIAACDAYVSLHRSEGFGYTIAEAMALGKPVIATPWSGPADYLTASNSFSVGYELIELGDDHGPYSAEQVWAEPSLDDAAAAMQRIVADPLNARLVGERASADILARYSPLAAGAVAANRIAWISDRLRHADGPHSAQGTRN
jgi:glycosyltransferase involved in cell wall biosynthesis